MSFLAPLFLFGLLAAAIPLAIHLIRRDKPPRVAFSTLRFFQKTSRKQFLFQKMQQWLLLLLRTVAIILLVFAFARPFFSEQLSRWADLAPRSVVLLIDNSMSMAYADTLERAKARAREILDDLNPGDEATLIVFNEEVEAVQGPSSDFVALGQAVEGIADPQARATRYFPALRLADELLDRSPNQERIVHLLSDFRKSGMEDFDANWKLKPGVQFVAANVGEEKTRNLAVTGVKAPSYLRKAAEEDEIFVRVRSFGSLRLQQADLRVSIDDQEQFRERVNLADQSEKVVRVPVSFNGEGSHVGRVSLNDPDFPQDNDFYFTVDVLPRIQVLLINGESSPQWFDDEAHWFRLALSSNDQSPFSLTTITPASFDPTSLAEYRVLALLNVGALPAEHASAIERFVRAGGSLLMAPGDQVEAGSFNRQLAEISPASLLERDSNAGGDYLLVAEANQRHPVLRNLQMDWTARFNQSWLLKPQENAEALMRFDDGSPALMERQVGEGRVLLFASSLDMEWNNLPLQGMYLPLVHESLKHLANTVEKKPAYRLGEHLALESRNAGEWRDPMGRALALPEGEQAITFDQPGIYMQGDKESAVYYAVNSPAEESDFTNLAASTILDQIVHPETEARQSAEVRTEMMKLALEKPQRLWWWILLVVGLLLLVETFVANRTYR